MKFIPQSEKKIDNNRRICIPLDGLGLAETFYYTTLCKINPNIVINPVKTNPNAYNIASVFNEIACHRKPHVSQSNKANFVFNKFIYHFIFY